ncbi:hypothetical protein ANCDUO_16935 [Ancylostoma duodenale]|uniref:Uncharacterized protein n=1 Tax=Ancylostoma duodenale TaxID=51022 RepID=A0A0C2FWL4_9BILA|nr:hypothetical protein ANCDUO_16935 [Ancylostoma duodenale]
MVSSDGSLTHEIIAWLKWPVALYGAECWTVSKEMKSRISVTEMRLLRWMGGITQLDPICNQDIRQRFGVAAIVDKLREARLR